MDKKRKMEKGKGEGLAAQACSASRPASAQQPSQPNHTRIRPAHAWPSLRPNVARAPSARQQSLPPWPHASAARRPRPRVFPFHLLPLPHRPRMSALLFIFSTPRPQPLTLNPLSDRAQTALAGAGQGVMPGACPCLLGAAPTQPRTTVGLPRPSLHRSITIRHGSLVHSYESPALIALAPRALNAPLPPCGYPLHTRAKRERAKRGRRKGAGERRSRRRSTSKAAGARTTPQRCTALHGIRSYTATTRHYTAIHSTPTPTVSPSSSPAHRRTLLLRPWRSIP